MIYIFKKKYCWAVPVAQQFSAVFSPGPDPGDPGSSPTLVCFFKDFLYLFTRDTQREREREREAETQAEGETGSPMWDLILGLQDHTLG